jgi:hypothetical protein
MDTESQLLKKVSAPGDVKYISPRTTPSASKATHVSIQTVPERTSNKYQMIHLKENNESTIVRGHRFLPAVSKK